jgi:hypothetical protein
VSETEAATDARFTYGVKVRVLAKGDGANVTELIAHGEAMSSIKKAKDSAAIELLRKVDALPVAVES